MIPNDDYMFPSYRGAEIALGLKEHTISGWIQAGKLRAEKAPYRTGVHLDEGMQRLRVSMPIRYGDIRLLVEAYQPRKRSDSVVGDCDPELPHVLTLKERLKQRREQEAS